MNVVRLGSVTRAPIMDYDSALAEAAPLADGSGEAHVYSITFQPGGVIGPHEAGFGQLFVFVDGAGWVADADGRRVPLGSGEVAFIRRGEIHSKGSDEGSTALMVQVRNLDER